MKAQTDYNRSEADRTDYSDNVSFDLCGTSGTLFQGNLTVFGPTPLVSKYDLVGCWDKGGNKRKSVNSFDHGIYIGLPEEKVSA